MIKFLLIFALFCPFFANSGQISDDYANKIANCIYKIEGGAQTKYPYGIKSIDTKGNKEFARRICLNTIKNNHVRWENSGKTNLFLDFLADKYCPISCDPVGNKNWKKNIKIMLAK